MSSFRVTALVVRKVDYGEADRIVTLLSPERGKLSAMARGARRSRRRFGSEMGLFALGSAELMGRRTGDLYDLRDWEMENPHFELGMELGRTVHASYVCEVAREFFGPEHAEPEAFALLVETLAVLQSSEPRAEVLRAFELRFLDAMGFGPVLDRCLSCDTEIVSDDVAGEGKTSAQKSGPAFRYDANMGGIRCFACSRAGIGLSSALLGKMLVARHAPNLLAAADHLRAVPEALRLVLRGTVEHHLGRPLASVSFVEKLHGMAVS